MTSISTEFYPERERTATEPPLDGRALALYSTQRWQRSEHESLELMSLKVGDEAVVIDSGAES